MNWTLGHFSGPPALRYAVDGHGPTLLLLHGVTRCRGDWQSLIPSLTKSWRVIALDQRGHGDSARADQYLVTDYVADAVAFVREHVAAPIVICGHSLGAMVAAAVAGEVPELVRGVVLEDPPFHTMGNRIEGSAWQALFIGMRDAARAGGTIDEMTDAMSEIQIPVNVGNFKPLGELRDRKSLAWSAECLQHLDAEVLTPIVEGRWLDGFNVAELLSRICCPALLLQADPSAGGALLDADAEWAMAAMPIGKRVRFPGVGHQLHATCPEKVLHAIEEFIPSTLVK